MKFALAILAAAVINGEQLPNPYYGYFSWNEGKGSRGTGISNSGIAYTKRTNVAEALQEYSAGMMCEGDCPKLFNPKLLSLGGGNYFWANGVLRDINDTAISQIKDAGYMGIVYIVESVLGSSSEMVPAFAASFAKVKAAGLNVIVSTTHSAPYDCDTPQDAVDLVKAWV